MPTGCVFVATRTAEEAALVISNQLVDWLDANGFDLASEMQVLSPQKSGPAGTTHLNMLLQHRLNPQTSRSAAKARPAQAGANAKPASKKLSKQAVKGQGSAVQVRVGDRVIQLANDYDAKVFNGDCGGVVSVTRLSAGEYRFIVEFDARPDLRDQELQRVEYPSSALDRTIGLSYALTVHKAQGSEYPAVLVPVLSDHSMMLYRNLLYTAMSRAKQLLVIVGCERAIARAVCNYARIHRNTLLAERITYDDFAPPTTRHL